MNLIAIIGGRGDVDDADSADDSDIYKHVIQMRVEQPAIRSVIMNLSK